MTSEPPHAHSHGHHGHARRKVGHRQDDDHGNPKFVTAAGSRHSEHAGHGGHDHGAMVADFRRRFWMTLV